jgi:hypothetical protein
MLLHGISASILHTFVPLLGLEFSFHAHLGIGRTTGPRKGLRWTTEGGEDLASDHSSHGSADGPAVMCTGLCVLLVSGRGFEWDRALGM